VYSNRPTRSRGAGGDYMIPTPVWKSSYRLIFDQSAQPTLEGWAIIDNTTGEDWTKVQLALVRVGRSHSLVSCTSRSTYIGRSQSCRRIRRRGR